MYGLRLFTYPNTFKIVWEQRWSDNRGSTVFLIRLLDTLHSRKSVVQVGNKNHKHMESSYLTRWRWQACQLIWNSQNQQLMGLAMTPKDLSSLNDIYKILQPSDILHTAISMRDLTSNYDIAGPYFICLASMKGKFVLACSFETIKLFQHYNLKTSLLVCDGGSANVAVIKPNHDCHGAYSIKDTSAQEDKFKIEPWIINPFNPPNKILQLICPSHQVCNFDVL